MSNTQTMLPFWPVSTLNRFKYMLLDLIAVLHLVNSDLKQILALANSDHNPIPTLPNSDPKPIRTLANSDPISKKSLVNSNLNFPGSELTSGRGTN